MRRRRRGSYVLELRDFGPVHLSGRALVGRAVTLVRDVTTRGGHELKAGSRLVIGNCWRGTLVLEHLDGSTAVRHVLPRAVVLVPAVEKRARCKHCDAYTVVMVDDKAAGAWDPSLTCGHCFKRIPAEVERV